MATIRAARFAPATTATLAAAIDTYQFSGRVPVPFERKAGYRRWGDGWKDVYRASVWWAPEEDEFPFAVRQAGEYLVFRTLTSAKEYLAGLRFDWESEEALLLEGRFISDLDGEGPWVVGKPVEIDVRTGTAQDSAWSCAEEYLTDEAQWRKWADFLHYRADAAVFALLDCPPRPVPDAPWAA